jgi:hypothetical protein
MDEPISASPGINEAQMIAENLVRILNQSEPAMFVIFAAALLEAQVVEVIGVAIPRVEKHLEITHETRVRILERMGIVTSPIAIALIQFGSIRNAFAHEPFACSFDTPKVLDRAKNLKRALEEETKENGLASFHGICERVNAETARLGGRPKWTHDVARTMVAGYFLLAYYLTWAKRLAPLPRKPTSINEIWTL